MLSLEDLTPILADSIQYIALLEYRTRVLICKEENSEYPPELIRTCIRKHGHTGPHYCAASYECKGDYIALPELIWY